MVDPIRLPSVRDDPPPDPPTPARRPPRALVDASAERGVDATLSMLDRVTVAAADARRCNAKDGPEQIGRMHAADPPTPMQVALDRFLASATASYRAGDTSATVTTFFRLEGGRHAIAAADALVRDRILAKAGLAGDGARVTVGRGTFEQIRRVTQALLDAGLLEPGEASLGERIRKTMWRYGVGIDCAGYVQLAFLASRGASREDFALKRAENEDLMGLAHNPRFARVAVTDARPGDVFLLGRTREDAFGHSVIVYSHAVADARTRELLLARCGIMATRFLRDARELHVYQVDSSWGAGKDGAPYGGIRRDTWLYDARSDAWARYDPAFGALGGTGFEQSESPCGHPIVGVFRPRNETSSR